MFVVLLGGVFILHTHVDVCRRSDVCSAAIEKKKKRAEETELFICFSCRVFRFVYASRWSEMTTNRSSYIRPAFWKVPSYGADDVLPMTVCVPPTLVPPTSSRLTQRRRSSNSGIKKRVHFADELYSGVSQETPQHIPRH